MQSYLKAVGAIVALCLVAAACDIISGGGDDGGGDGETVTLTASADPSDAGSVDPDSAEFDPGTEIAVQASANDGWLFDSWSGDTSATDNPLVFVIEENTSLTANFREAQEAFRDSITVADGTNDITLDFGMAQSATDGYDDGLDVEAPPKPPEGAFFGHFVITDYNLVTDMRGVTTTSEEVWELNFAPEEGNTITLSWDINESNIKESLTLMDDPDNPSVEINMLEDNSYQVSDTSVNTLYIVFNDQD